jgi:hypothetical protein
VANRRARDSERIGAARDSERRVAASVASVPWQCKPSANDNRAPLAVRLQRLLFLVTAGASLGWLFWVGALR